MEEMTSKEALEILTQLQIEVQALRTEINKYKGFAGGIWFVLSCIGIFIGAFKFFQR